MSDASPRILLVEDDESLRLALSDNLGAEGYRVEAVGRGGEALERMKCPSTSSSST